MFSSFWRLASWLGEVAPLAVVRALHAELRLEDRAVLQVALEHLLEEGGEARVLGRGLRGRVLGASRAGRGRTRTGRRNRAP